MRQLMHRPGLWNVVILLLVACLPGFIWQPHQATAVREDYRSPMAPVFLVPGSSATQNRFNDLVNQLNQSSKNKHSLLRVEVMENGHLKYSGQLRHGDQRPYIVVGFQNHRDGYANILKQAKWFTIAFKALQATYKFNHFSGMGHSNGGLVLTLFMEHDLAKTGAKADRLMTIGTPFNLEVSDPDKDTQLFKELTADRDRLPRQLIVYSIAGSKTFTGDGIVPFDSVNRGKYIFQGRVKGFTQMTITGADANHADLPENQQIAELIQQDLLS
ncbi:alpha/beta hydrolase [Levilactobacillus tangyuanensis]|uniref:Alpha/beta hydrolase n=1 Tax=Levilactobacillus tangyuanensis TaxID=2486021 RepID=A0ABW1TLQ4_9LACO|nr:alpha/beta hydrolase [Levilactobacillus tangyuanensis]